MDKKYNKEIKSLNLLLESLMSEGVDEIKTNIKALNALILTDKIKLEDRLYKIGDFKIESNFYNKANEKSETDLELIIFLPNNKNIHIEYDYDYNYDTEENTEGTEDVGYNTYFSKINEDEEFFINSVTLYDDGVEIALLSNPNEFVKEITNIIKSTNFKNK